MQPVKLSKEGIDVEMTLTPLSDGAGAQVLEQEDLELKFKIVDSRTGNIISGVNPAAWIDPKTSFSGGQGTGQEQPTPPSSCDEKIKWFMQGSLSMQPAIDLNTYFVLALNDNATISVINPQLGFYISKLLTFIQLESPGEDWALTRDAKRLFVTMPQVNRVAIANMENWKVVKNVDVGANPVRVALQPDEQYVWVSHDSTQPSESAVTVIRTETMEVAARIPVGGGHHEMAFSTDSKYAFVMNGGAGSVSVIDIARLEKIKEIGTGSTPVSIAFSSSGQSVYVAHEEDGRIAVIDGNRHEIVATIPSKPGLKAIRFSPDGRWGFVVNQKENEVDVVDASLNRIAHTIPVEAKPDHVSFSTTFAYVRPAASDQVNAIQLSLLDKTSGIKPLKFPAGQGLPDQTPSRSLADVIVPTPEGDVVLIANETDKIIYYYMEGMLAPMGSFKNYGRIPKAVLVVDRSLKETAPGVYATVFKAPAGGKYDVAFLLDSPLMHLCFDIDVKDNPAVVKKLDTPVALEFLTQEKVIPVGEASKLLLRLTDPATRKPNSGIKDLRVLFSLVPGVWQQRMWATSVGDGIYEVDLTPPESGYYQVFFECPSLKVKYVDLPHLVLQAKGGNEPEPEEVLNGGEKEAVPSDDAESHPSPEGEFESNAE